MKCFLLLLLLIPLNTWSASYPTSDADCAGYPRANIETKAGLCVGVVAQANDQITWRKPRRIVQVPNTKQFIVTDMGGWTRERGKVWLLDTATKPAKLTSLIDKLKLPHGLAIGPKGLFYIGETDRIFRFQLQGKKAVNIETVVSRLPDFKKHSHPLTHFIFDQHNNLVINVGAPSDQCQADKHAVLCSSVNNTLDTHAAIRRYPYIAEANVWGIEYEVIAYGLRNSMALASHKQAPYYKLKTALTCLSCTSPLKS